MTGESAFDAAKIEQPDPKLFRYYVLAALMTGPLSPFVLIPLWLRYATLRYKFDDSGVSMKVGVLFRREVHLTYRRIQDIQLTRNLFQRWMGLPTISLQTASGSSDAEISIEGKRQSPTKTFKMFPFARDPCSVTLESLTSLWKQLAAEPPQVKENRQLSLAITDCLRESQMLRKFVN